MDKTSVRRMVVGTAAGFITGGVCLILAWLMSKNVLNILTEFVFPMLAAGPYYLFEKTLLRFSIKTSAVGESVYLAFIFLYWVFAGSLFGLVTSWRSISRKALSALLIITLLGIQIWGVRQFRRDMEKSMRGVAEGVAKAAIYGRDMLGSIARERFEKEKALK